MAHMGNIFGSKQGYLSRTLTGSETGNFVETQFFRDSALWWDCSHDSRTTNSRDLGRKKLLWLSNPYEPESQLLARSVESPASPSNSTWTCNPGPGKIPWYARQIMELADKGQLREAVDALGLLVQTGYRVSTFLFYTLLRRCMNGKNLVLGQLVHGLVIRNGYESNLFLANHILRMYASHARVNEARDVFTSVATPDAYMWSSMISAHVGNGEAGQAVLLYHQMQNLPVKPDCHVFVAALKACAGAGDLESGRQVHADILSSGLRPNVFIGSCLIDMYAKCGRLKDAQLVFDTWPSRNVVTWTAMIAGYAEHGFGQEALALYAEMEQEDVVLANNVTFACLLKACASVGALQQGKQLHSQILELRLNVDILVGNCLVDMYAKCGSLEDARRAFDSLPTKDVVTWNSMMNGYTEHGLGEEALALYFVEWQVNTVANNFTFACLLKACASIGALKQGKQLHSEILKRGFDADIVVGNSLVHMYAKCGSLQDARAAFESLPSRNVVTWTTLIAGYAEHGFGYEALDVYARMRQDGMILADNVTFASLLKACTSIGALQQGKQLHAQIMQTGQTTDLVVGNCLVVMYAKCGSLNDARRVFDNLPRKDVITWNSMVTGYTEYGHGQEALALYTTMESEGMIAGDSVTFACLVKACASIGALDTGKHIHSQILQRGLMTDVVIGNSLVDMYAKCGSLADAHNVFDRMLTKDVVTWTTLIAAYAEHGLGQEALALYTRLKQDACTVTENVVTFACLLKACTIVGAVQQGKQLHVHIRERGLESDIIIGTCLVDMYAKFGSMKDARMVFDMLPAKNVTTWTAMVNGFGHNNEGQKAIQCFQQMLQDGVQPDETTFICLLVACSHEGLVNEGRHYFNAMLEDHSIVPTGYHYACMVDLLGRSGYLDEAESLLTSMPCESDVVGWTSLLNACRSYGDIERGGRCFEKLLELDPYNASAYVLMAKMYAEADRWTCVERIESLRKSLGASKKPAKAGIEVDMQVHTFVVGEERDDVPSLNLRGLNARLKEGGHVPHTELVLKPVSEKEKEDELCGHAEKLALAYGLLNTPNGAPLLVTKNLRMCGDCHSATQIMSRLEKREIIVRDAHRVHRFVEGSCSCGNRP